MKFWLSGVSGQPSLAKISFCSFCPQSSKPSAGCGLMRGSKESVSGKDTSALWPLEAPFVSGRRPTEHLSTLGGSSISLNSKESIVLFIDTNLAGLLCSTTFRDDRMTLF